MFNYGKIAANTLSVITISSFRLRRELSVFYTRGMELYERVNFIFIAERDKILLQRIIDIKIRRGR